jgi:hypothetical protein
MKKPLLLLFSNRDVKIGNSRANLELLGGHFESLCPLSEGQGFIMNTTLLKIFGEIRTGPGAK